MVLWRLGVVAASKSGATITAGYMAGGVLLSSPFPNVSTVDKWIYATETRTTLGTGLARSNARYSGILALNQVTYVVGSGEPNVTSIIKFTYATDTNALLSETISGPDGYFMGVIGTTKGYLGGGVSQANVTLSTIRTFTYSTETLGSLGSNLSNVRVTGAGCGGTSTGYFAGGYGVVGSGTSRSTVDKVTYSTDAISTLGTGLSGSLSSCQPAISPTAAHVIGTVHNTFSFSDDSRAIKSDSPGGTAGFGTTWQTKSVFYYNDGNALGNTGVYKHTMANDSWATMSSSVSYSAHRGLGFCNTAQAGLPA